MVFMTDPVSNDYLKINSDQYVSNYATSTEKDSILGVNEQLRH